MPLRDPYNQVSNNLLVVADSSQLQPFITVPGMWPTRVHTGQLSVENDLYCVPFPKVPVIFCTSPHLSKRGLLSVLVI